MSGYDDVEQDRVFPLNRPRTTKRPGVSLFSLARRMGTSVEQIDKTYGHLLPDAVEYERSLLDAFDAREGEAEAPKGRRSAV
jgi:hypothetical protein